MRRILSIFSSDKVPAAFLCALFIIAAAETASYFTFAKRYAHHEVDTALRQIASRDYNADYLLIGDSVGRQLLEQFAEDPGFAVLATNSAIETTGQLFITRRYLEKNAKVKAVIFVAGPFLHTNLEQNFTENFVFRTFTRLDEIIAVASVKADPAVVMKMFAYKWLQTYKFRLRLQDKIVDFTNSNIYSGVDAASQVDGTTGNHALFQIIRRHLKNRRSSTVHFLELLDYLQERDIVLYYIPAPVMKGAQSIGLYRQLLEKILPELRQKYPILHFSPRLIQHRKEWFRDGVHYTPESLPMAEKYIESQIRLITSP